ncbi:hypothetical protein DUI87_18680 [Hirundo rustica rustica]|uniref:Uncharacterized protein n=1 Tax=Hirundo rustica rustica TaxID=333673 RepID=A0A3M0KE95_HIRRU|nr:hypothetical protein DUI87_18680 [Hirundo rustica rustica]
MIGCSNIDGNHNFNGTYSDEVFEVLKVATLVEKAAQQHTAPEALEEVVQNPILQLRKSQVASPPSILPFLLTTCLCEASGQSLVKRSLLNCLVASE